MPEESKPETPAENKTPAETKAKPEAPAETKPKLETPMTSVEAPGFKLSVPAAYTSIVLWVFVVGVALGPEANRTRIFDWFKGKEPAPVPVPVPTPDLHALIEKAVSDELTKRGLLLEDEDERTYPVGVDVQISTQKDVYIESVRGPLLFRPGGDVNQVGRPVVSGMTLPAPVVFIVDSRGSPATAIPASARIKFISRR